MKIILSPSKTQNRKKLTSSKQTMLLNEDKTRKLFDILNRYSRSEIKKLMKVKNILLDETYDMYQIYPEKVLSKKAIKLYQGVAFEQIKTDTYNHSQTSYLDNHLFILSAMYGAIKANSYISPYRLDMTMKPNGINLYDYWQEDMSELFKDEDYIINLASKEFSKMLKPLKDKLITIDFKDENMDGKLRTISYNAKKARGEMVHQLTLHLVNDIEKIKSLVVNDYQFNDALSSKSNLIFVKKHQ